MTQVPNQMNDETINKLRAPFGPDRIEWRLQSSGKKQDGSFWAKCLCYIDNRAAMERLDEVYGQAWSHSEEFKQIGTQAVCTVTITIESPRGEGIPLFPYRSVTGSCAVEANGDIDPFKSAASGAMKRAVVNLGIGRYLYDLPEAWAVIDPNGKYQGATKDKQYFKWNPPQLPKWAGGGADVNYASNQQEEAPAYVPAPAPRPAQAPVASDGTWRTVVIPFGKQQGQTLGQLNPASLKWWRENYQPKPYKGKISDKDTAFRNALDQSEEAYKPMPTASKSEVIIDDEPSDDVPF